MGETSRSPTIPASSRALGEALVLAEEILRNLELGEIPLGRIVLKAGRLARLLNDFVTERMMDYEAGGYPKTPAGFTSEVWEVGGLAGRHFIGEDKDKKPQHYMFAESIEELEAEVDSAKAALAVSHDPDVSYSSANPNQLFFPQGNAMERMRLQRQIEQATRRVGQCRRFIHQYVRAKYYELKFSGIAQDIFARLRERVDSKIGNVVPDAVKRLSAAADNLQSENPEDWANAAHSCRRILVELADAVFPASPDQEVEVDGAVRSIRLDRDAYINRLMTFVTEQSGSKRFQEIVGSHLRYLGDRLDSVHKAAQKGSHAEVTREEAERCLVFTYLLVADIVSLVDSNSRHATESASKNKKAV